MGEALPKYTPANDHDGEVVSLKIISSIDNTRNRFDRLRPDRFTESQHNENNLEEEGEGESYGVDSPEGLLKAREYTRQLAVSLVEWETSSTEVSDNERLVLEYIRQQISDVNDLIRYQNDAFAFDASDKEIQQRAEKIAESINILSEDYESLSSAAGDETGELMAELADGVRNVETPKGGVDMKAEEEIIPNIAVMSKLKQLEKKASSFVNQGLDRQKNDYSGHMPGQNSRLKESLFYARDEVFKQTTSLRDKLDRGEKIRASEISSIEEELQRMQKAYDMLPSVNEMHTKEDFERPKSLNKTEIEELKHLSTKDDVLPMSLVANLTQENFTAIQDDYEELQVLTEDVQQEALRILTLGSYLSREKEAINQTLSKISQIRRKIEEMLLSEKEDTDTKEAEVPSEIISGEKRNFVSYPISEDTTSRKTVHVNGVPMGSYPLEKKGAVMMSHKNPEELFPEPDKPELTAETIEEYRDWVESIHAEALQAETLTNQQAEEMAHKPISFDEPTVEEVDMESPENQLLYAFLKALNLNEDQIKAMLSKRSTRDRLLDKARKWQQEFGTSAKGDSNGPASENTAKDTTGKKETSEPMTLREEWLEAKHAHAEAEREYLEALEAFYGGFTVRARTTFGFKPDLPDEIKELSRQRAKTAALYSQAADRMVEAKKQEKPVLDKYLERHKRLQARTLLLRTFEDQQNVQKKAAETKYPGVREFFQKHGKKIRYGSAATLGFVTGGILGASYSITRALGGAAVTGQAVQFVGKKYDEKVAAAREKFEADYSAEAEQLISLLQNKGSLSEQELAEVIVKLDELASHVDAATQERIRAVMATAIGVSLAFGGGTAALDDMFFAETVDAQSSTGVPTEEINPVSDVAASNDRVVIDVSTKPDAAVTADAGAAGVPGTTEYTVQRGDSLWDIVEGQTEAGKFSALEGLSEADKQEAIARLAETFNENEELRERFGMGDTADMLYADEKIDTAALNEMLADEIKEHNIGVEEAETPGDSSSNTAASAGGDASSAGGEPAAGAEGAGASTEKTLMKSVSVAAVNEYAREYTGGGYVKFEQDFEKLFVERVQGPTPATGGLMSFIFGGTPNTADAYKLFSPYTIAEFNELNRVSESALAEALAQDGIDINDYRAWRDELRNLRAQGMTINPTDRFEDVAKAAFINSLNQPKTT